MEMADGDRFTPEQAEAMSALRDGRNVFLSGNAGTGKSYVLNAFISDLKARNVDFLALAPTGIAAGLVEAVLPGDAVCDEEYGGLEAVGDIEGFAGGFGRGDRVGHGPPLYWNWHTQQL